MTTESDTVEAQADLAAAERALAAFDASTLVNEDGSPNDQAQAALRRLQQRVDTAHART